MTCLFAIPDEYKVGKQFDTKTFITSDLTPKEKTRFREAVQEIVLEYQIAGETIPSLINAEYDCQAILLFEVKLNSLKDASFVGGIIQRLVKPLCVVNFCDITGMNTYHFAHKRLNMQDSSQIVIEDIVSMIATSTDFDTETNLLMREYIAFNKIKNRANKLGFYLEMMVKSYIISNLLLWSGSKKLLDTKLWYNDSSILQLYTQLRQVEQLKREQKSAKTIADNSKINSKLKIIYGELDKISAK